MAIKVPESPPTKTIVYTDLLGVDFSQDASLVDRQHSPDMLNMISDEGGSPVKRKGWEVLYQNNNYTFKHIWHFRIASEDYIACCYKNGNTEWLAFFNEETGTFGPMSGIASDESIVNDAFFMNDALYVISSNGGYHKFTVKDGVKRIEQVHPKIPTILISRDPVNGGGKAYYDINLLTSSRSEQFLDTVGSTRFLLSTTTEPFSDSITVEYLSNGEWVEDPTATLDVQGSKYYAVINTSHGAAQGGIDNIKVTYSTQSSGASKIFGCTNHGFFSHGNLDQIFLTGNPDYPNYVWYSDYGDPTYFPDLNYMIIGNAGTKCMGFLNVGENLAVIKESSDDDSSIFFVYETSLTPKTVSTDTATGSESETTQEYVYAVKRATSGVGAIAKACFNTLQDEPLFLSENGVQGLVSTNSTTEKVVRNRSKHVDRKLLAEDHLEKAISCVCNGYYYIFINSHVYVLDSRHVAADRRGNTTYAYEAYYWDNVPASCVCTVNGVIYFGTADGRLCRFKNTGEMTDYSDGSHYDETQQMQVGGVAIHARYATKNDDDNAPQYFKTMMKKGSMCTVAPYFKSSVDVYVMADGTPATAQELYYDRNHQQVYDDAVPGIYIGTHYSNVDNIFPRIDFSRLLFDTRRSPRDYFFRKKKKKYVRLQITLENRELNEGFGVYSIVKTYTMTRYAK